MWRLWQRSRRRKRREKKNGPPNQTHKNKQQNENIQNAVFHFGSCFSVQINKRQKLKKVSWPNFFFLLADLHWEKRGEKKKRINGIRDSIWGEKKKQTRKITKKKQRLVKKIWGVFFLGWMDAYLRPMQSRKLRLRAMRGHAWLGKGRPALRRHLTATTHIHNLSKIPHTTMWAG